MNKLLSELDKRRGDVLERCRIAHEEMLKWTVAHQTAEAELQELDIAIRAFRPSHMALKDFDMVKEERLEARAR